MDVATMPAELVPVVERELLGSGCPPALAAELAPRLARVLEGAVVEPDPDWLEGHVLAELEEGSRTAAKVGGAIRSAGKAVWGFLTRKKKKAPPGRAKGDKRPHGSADGPPKPKAKRPTTRAGRREQAAKRKAKPAGESWGARGAELEERDDDAVKRELARTLGVPRRVVDAVILRLLAARVHPPLVLDLATRIIRMALTGTVEAHELEAAALAECERVLAGELHEGLGDELEARMSALLDAPTYSTARARELADWLEATFRFKASRTPRGQKVLKDRVDSLWWNLKHGSAQREETVRARWEEVQPHITALARYFTAEGGVSVPRELVVGQNTYRNPKGFTEEKLRGFVSRLEGIFASLKGWRKKALDGGLVVVLAGPKEFRGTAKGMYRSERDELWVRASPKVVKRSGSAYGGFEYIIVHELGHRWERKGRVPVDFDRQEWQTTAYSMQDGESFPELFALGHFGESPGASGPDRRAMDSSAWETVERFEELMRTGGRTRAQRVSDLVALIPDDSTAADWESWGARGATVMEAQREYVIAFSTVSGKTSLHAPGCRHGIQQRRPGRVMSMSTVMASSAAEAIRLYREEGDLDERGYPRTTIAPCARGMDEERDYRKEYLRHSASPKEKKKRVARNTARRRAIAAGKAKKGDGTHVHHMDGNAEHNGKGNLSVRKATTHIGSHKRKESWGARGATLEESVPHWVRRAADRGETYEGPNGNEAIGYEWKWKWGLKHSKAEDGLVDARVSDWDEALQCVTCGRSIVHIYYVKAKETGQVETYGVEHLHVALGYPRAVGKKRQREILGKIDARGLADKRAAAKMTRLTRKIAKETRELEELRARLAIWDKARAEAEQVKPPPVEYSTKPSSSGDITIAKMGDAEVWLTFTGGKLDAERERTLRASWLGGVVHDIYKRMGGPELRHGGTSIRTSRPEAEALEQSIAKAKETLHALMPGKVTQDVGESWGAPGGELTEASVFARLPEEVVTDDISDAEFARLVHIIAASTKRPFGPGSSKAWISHVWNVYKMLDHELQRPGFDQRLIRAARSGAVNLTRLDMAGEFPRRDVVASTVRMPGGGKVNFIRIPRQHESWGARGAELTEAVEVFTGFVRKLTGYAHEHRANEIRRYVQAIKQPPRWQKGLAYAVTLELEDGSVVWFQPPSTVDREIGSPWWERGAKPSVAAGDILTVRGTVKARKPGRGGAFIALRSGRTLELVKKERGGGARSAGAVEQPKGFEPCPVCQVRSKPKAKPMCAACKDGLYQAKRLLRGSTLDIEHVENNYRPRDLTGPMWKREWQKLYMGMSELEAFLAVQSETSRELAARAIANRGAYNISYRQDVLDAGRDLDDTARMAKVILASGEADPTWWRGPDSGPGGSLGSGRRAESLGEARRPKPLAGAPPGMTIVRGPDFRETGNYYVTWEHPDGVTLRTVMYRNPGDGWWFWVGPMARRVPYLGDLLGFTRKEAIDKLSTLGPSDPAWVRERPGHHESLEEARVSVIPKAAAEAAIARARRDHPGEWRAEAMELVLLPVLRRKVLRRYGIKAQRVRGGYVVWTARGTLPWNENDPDPGVAWNAYQRKTDVDLHGTVDALRMWARARTKRAADDAINPYSRELSAWGVWIDNEEYLALPESETWGARGGGPLSEMAAIDFSKIDLPARFRELNRLYFGGTLPRETKVRFSSRLKRATGVTRAKIKMRPGAAPLPRGRARELIDVSDRVITYDPRINMATKLRYEEELFDVFLLHEMCHLWLIYNGYPFEGHGHRFKAKAAEIGRAAGVKIPMTHETTGKEELGVAAKEVALAVTLAKPTPYVLMFKPSQMAAWQRKLEGYSFNNPTHIYLLRTKAHALLSYRTARGKGLKWSYLKGQVREELGFSEDGTPPADARLVRSYLPPRKAMTIDGFELRRKESVFIRMDQPGIDGGFWEVSELPHTDRDTDEVLFVRGGAMGQMMGAARYQYGKLLTVAELKRYLRDGHLAHSKEELPALAPPPPPPEPEPELTRQQKLDALIAAIPDDSTTDDW